MPSRYAFAYCLTCVFSLVSLAQVNGKLSGSVVDPSGAAVPGASVEVYLAGGQSALLETKTNNDGLFTFPSLRPETYDVVISGSGFAKSALRSIKIEALKESVLPPVKLELAQAAQVVEVSADAPAVQLGSSELVATIARQQIENLPTASRQVSALFQTQAGVSDGRGPTVINGLRTSAANVTLDGINIQDNFIRTNSLDFMPIRPTIDQLSEMSIAVGNAGSTVGGGAAQVTLTTRSGSNQTHGSLYWFNQNQAYNANDFFSNRANVAKPKLNQNQVGVALGGRVIKDKLFYFGNFEALRLKQQASQLRTVLVPEARNGNFLYRSAPGGPVQSVNVLALRNLQADPTMRQMIASLPNPNSTDTGDGVLTSGFRFNARSNTIRDQFVNRWDYYLTPAHNFTVTYNRTSEYVDRPDLTTRFYDTVSPNNTDTTRNFLSTGWRWTAGPTITNEVRFGFLRSPSQFFRVDAAPAQIVNPTPTTLFTYPQNSFLNQGRKTRTYSFQDNANWLKGRHNVSFGMQTQWVRIYSWGDNAPVATLGLSASFANGLVAANLPGISNQDLTRANDYLATLAGITTNVQQTVVVNDPAKGFTKDTQVNNYANDTWSFYVEDRWRATDRLTLTFGLRYEYWTVLKESNNLWLLPNVVDNNIISTLRNPNAQLDFVNKNGRALYRPDRNNFAPSFGFAFDPTGRGKTAIRGSYGIAFFNDELLTAVNNNAATNPGISTNLSQFNLTGTLASLPNLPIPAFTTPLGLPGQYLLNRQVAIGSPDFGLATPYAQMYTFGVQHEIKGNIVEVRYVGNHGTKLLRAFDYNQVDIRGNGFLDDFRRLQAAPGTVPPGLPVISRLGPTANLLTAANQQLIRQGEVGTLAANLQIANQQGSVRFFPNDQALATNAIANGANSTYNALQVEVRRRVRDLNFQANYTWSKTLSDISGDTQTRFEPLLDFGNNALERARTPFDLRHAFKFNTTYMLPFGAGKRWQGNRAVNHVIGGWMIAANHSYLSGFPFNVLSQRGTLNRGPRATGRNTAVSNLTYQQITNDVFKLQKRGNGVYFIDPAYTSAAGRGVSDNEGTTFANQAFFNPAAGTVGTLQRRLFSGPTTFALDLALKKTIHIGERHSLQFGADAFNLLNKPAFFMGVDQDINSVNFNRITALNNNPRTLQFSLYYRF